MGEKPRCTKVAQNEAKIRFEPQLLGPSCMSFSCDEIYPNHKPTRYTIATEIIMLSFQNMFA